MPTQRDSNPLPWRHRRPGPGSLLVLTYGVHLRHGHSVPLHSFHRPRQLTTGHAATSYRRLQPGLTLQASPGRLRKGVQIEVRFTVHDAGDAVGGARVKAGGRSGTTDTKGRVTLTLTSADRDSEVWWYTDA